MSVFRQRAYPRRSGLDRHESWGGAGTALMLHLEEGGARGVAPRRIDLAARARRAGTLAAGAAAGRQLPAATRASASGCSKRDLFQDAPARRRGGRPAARPAGMPNFLGLVAHPALTALAARGK
jgi:hypothetical protein